MFSNSLLDVMKCFIMLLYPVPCGSFNRLLPKWLTKTTQAWQKFAQVIDKIVESSDSDDVLWLWLIKNCLNFVIVWFQTFVTEDMSNELYFRQTYSGFLLVQLEILLLTSLHQVSHVFIMICYGFFCCVTFTYNKDIICYWMYSTKTF